MSEQTYLVSKTRCPECAKMGNDNEGDNLANYSDLHSWCYSCGYYVKGDSIKRFKDSLEYLNANSIPLVHLPLDSTLEYPQKALDWVYQYELTIQDLLTNNVVWSDYYHRLIFPVFGDVGLLAWQGRYFGDDPKSAKWFGRGNLSETYNILGQNPDCIILVEDIISSIRCSKYHTTMALFGSHISSNKWKHLKILGYNKVVIFLDPDKRKEAIKFSKDGINLGFTVRTVFSGKDPKELDEKTLKELLTFL